ncbi:hypothetical protein [Lactiplantibacillus pentosus]|uniref:hypothetical protein n=1 Tax=Lactiplantibacillus pentosus TaxID=1589 RepID=UPI000B53EAEA|nr:hypothetical protein [Lactiplantibacillus pentosus]ASG79307.1 hypothetical protein CEW82_05385 [Lactiplantibacillus pentosus]MDO7804886.1 hypothetical protein [Lactiplantibacillus pentosus]
MNKAEEPKEPTYDELIQKISHKSWLGGMSMPTREEINALLAARWRERDEAERKLKASKQHEDQLNLNTKPTGRGDQSALC